MLRVSSGCAFFPTGLSVLHPAGRPQQYIATHVDRQPAEHRQTRMQVLPHICNLQRPSCSGCHQSEQTRPLFPSANQRASSSFMPKLIRWRPSDSFISQIQIEVLHQHVNIVLPMWAREIQDLSFISVSGMSLVWEHDRQLFHLSHQSHPRWWWWLMMIPSFITYNPNTCMPGQ